MTLRAGASFHQVFLTMSLLENGRMPLRGQGLTHEGSGDIGLIFRKE